MPHFPGSVSGASKVRLAFLLVGPLSSTDSAAAFGPALFARFLGTMGPSDSLETCMSAVRQCLLGPSHTLRRGSFQGLPISVQRVSTHAQGLRLRGVHERLAIGVVHDVAFPLSEQGRHAERLISELNGWPACAPVNASPAMLPPPAHDSRLERLAIPFLCDSFIRYSSPAFIGAFSDPNAHQRPTPKRPRPNAHAQTPTPRPQRPQRPPIPVECPHLRRASLAFAHLPKRITDVVCRRRIGCG